MKITLNQPTFKIFYASLSIEDKKEFDKNMCSIIEKSYLKQLYDDKDIIKIKEDINKDIKRLDLKSMFQQYIIEEAKEELKEKLKTLSISIENKEQQILKEALKQYEENYLKQIFEKKEKIFDNFYSQIETLLEKNIKNKFLEQIF